MQLLVDFMVSLEGTLTTGGFVALSLVISVLLCFLAIPYTTHLMVNNAAGIGGRMFGPNCRTLIINASTNNPEAAAMIVAMCTWRFGGWANPNGSLFANIYLMFLFAPVIVTFKWILTGRAAKARTFWKMMVNEKRLVAWHFTMATGGLAIGYSALMLMRHGFAFRHWFGTPEGEDVINNLRPMVGRPMWAALFLILLALVLFFILERRVKTKQPELFHEIDDSEHGQSYVGFIGGTLGLILACGIMNAIFLAWTQLYSDTLSSVLGPAVFTYLHFFLGALITSLPELLIATKNFQRLSVPDLHTALGGASYSNVTNLALAFLGLLAFAIMASFGSAWQMPWE